MWRRPNALTPHSNAAHAPSSPVCKQVWWRFVLSNYSAGLLNGGPATWCIMRCAVVSNANQAASRTGHSNSLPTCARLLANDPASKCIVSATWLRWSW